MSKIRKYKKGHIYEIEFFDHCISDKSKIITCKAVGFFHSDNDDYITIEFWNSDDEDLRDDCKEFSNIIKSTIVASRELR